MDPFLIYVGQFVSNFVNKASKFFNESYGSKFGIISKQCYTKNQNEHDVEITEPTSIHPLIEQHFSGSRLITIDTEAKTVFEDIAKPDEAGGQ